MDGETKSDKDTIMPSIVDGSIAGTVAAGMDVTERQQPEEAKQGSEEHQRELLHETRALLAKTEALYRVSRSLIASRDLPGLLQAVVDGAAEALPANRVRLITLDLERRQVTYEVKGGPGVGHWVDSSFDQLWDGLTGWVLREMKPALSPKVGSDPRESSEVQRRRANSNCGAIIVVPLHHQGGALGTITAINCPEDRDFTQEDVELAMAMASQAAIAIENSHLYGELQLAHAELEQRVEERTAALARANVSLQAEITERKAAEQALTLSESRLQGILSSMQDQVFVFDKKGSFTHYYAPDNELYVTAEEPVGRRPSEVMPPDIGRLFTTAFDQCKEGKGADFEYKIEVGGKTKWYGARLSPLYSDDELVGAVVVVREITQRKQAEEELEKAHEELETRVTGRTRELSVLYEVAAAASRSLDLEEVLSFSLERVLEAVSSDAGVIQLLEENAVSSTGRAEHSRLRIVVQRGSAPEIAAQTSFPWPARDLGRWVLEHGEMLIVPDLTTDPHTAMMPASASASYVGVPLRSGGRIVGVLGVIRKVERPPYSVEELSLLTSIADQLGVAVESTQLRKQLERAAVTEERERLARDLHDSVTQLLYTVNLCAVSGRRALEQDQITVLADSLSQLGDAAQQALREMRLMLYELRPSLLAQEGLVSALHHRLNTVERRVGVSAELLTSGDVDLDERIEQELYHIALEALNNALKHAKASAVTVSIGTEGDRVEIKVVDNGAGFALAALETTRGMGLVIMRERARELGADLTIDSAPGAGTQVRVSVPYDGTSSGKRAEGAAVSTKDMPGYAERSGGIA